METAKNRSNLRYTRFEQNILQYYKYSSKVQDRIF